MFTRIAAGPTIWPMKPPAAEKEKPEVWAEHAKKLAEAIAAG